MSRRQQQHISKDTFQQVQHTFWYISLLPPLLDRVKLLNFTFYWERKQMSKSF